MNNEIQLMHGDCLEKMKEIPSESIDLILCDPPFGTTQNKWDSVIPFDKMWAEYKRIIKKKAAIVLFAQSPFDKILGASNIDMLKYEWIWLKQEGTGFLNAKRMPLKIHENILVFAKGSTTYNPIMRGGYKPYKSIRGNLSTNYGKVRNVRQETVSNGERYPIDVLNFCRDSSHFHPTQKPVALLSYLIKTYTNENEVVLDNTMGSGSTGVAAIQTDRNFIGIEMDDKYFSIAEKRIREAKKERDSMLF